MNESESQIPSSRIPSLSLAEEWIQLQSTGVSLSALNQFLDTHIAGRGRELGDVLLADQQFRWSDGPGPRVEEYLQLFPDLNQDLERLTDLVYGEARASTKLGFPVSMERFQARFPEIAEELAKQFEVADWLSEAPVGESESAGAPRGSASRIESLQRLGDYELITPIARGGMGVVYQARHRMLDRIVALKMIPRERLVSGEGVQRFKNEVSAVSQLDHPGILPIFEVGESEGVPYFTSRLIQPGALADQYARFQGKPFEIAELVRMVADSIQHAHERGVLHRDLNPSNVLIDFEGTPYVTDFGLAKLLDQPGDLTHSGDLLGTPVWLAPEQVTRKPGVATIAGDVYGIGVILYFLLTGRAPFKGTGLIDTLSQISDQEPVRPSQIDPAVARDLEMICLKAIDKNPARRYATARLLESDLTRFLRRLPVAARPLPWWEHQRRKVRRHPVAAGVLSAFIACAASLIALAIHYTVNEGKLNSKLSELVHEAEVSKHDTGLLRVEATRAKETAEQMSADAASARDQARLIKHNHELLLYTAHIKHAEEALKLGDARRAHDMLNRIASNKDFAELRGFEWFWLHRQIDMPVLEIAVDLDNPRCLAYSADGARFAIGDSSGRVVLFDTSTRQQLVSWPTAHEMVQCVAFAPGAPLLATAGSDGTVCTWSAVDGSLQDRFTLTSGGASRTDFLDDTKLVASNGASTLFMIDIASKAVVEFAGELGAVYDITTCKETGEFAAIGESGVGVWSHGSTESKHRIGTRNTPTTQSIRFSGKGHELAFRSGYHEVQIWSISGDQPVLMATEEMLDEPWGVAFSPDDRVLAMCDRVGVLHLLALEQLRNKETSTRRSVTRWQAHEGRANALSFSPQGTDLASIGKDAKLKIWKPRPAEFGTTLAAQAYVDGYLGGISFFPKSQVLAAGSEHGIQLWDVEDKSLRRTIDATGVRRDLVAITSDEKYVAAGQKSDAFVELWSLDASARRPKWRVESQQCDQLVFSPDDRMLAVVDYFRDEVVLLETSSGKKQKTLPARQCWAAAFSPDGAILAVTALDDVYVWSCADWKLKHELKGHRSTTTTVAISPDGKWIASGSKDRAIRIWDAASGQESHRMLGHQDVVDEITFSPDSKSLVSLSRDGTVRVWHVATGESLCELWNRRENPPCHLAFSSDGTRLTIRMDLGQILLVDVSQRSETAHVPTRSTD